MDTNPRTRGYYTPPPTWASRRRLESPMSERRRSPACKGDLFHVIHKVPSGDSPYVRAKHVQLIDKDPSKSISLFWAAINAGDRVDSALKDMAIVMKQLNRSDEAIEAIISFRHLCPHDSQDSLDNVLIELYKRSGRIEEEIEMLQKKLRQVEEGNNFCGKRTKSARSQGKKTHVTVEQERSRILGNMAWAYLQLKKYNFAEELYRKALALEPDKNKQCNLALCLMHMNNVSEAKSLLDDVKGSVHDSKMDESYVQSFERAFQMLKDLESHSRSETPIKDGDTCRDRGSVSTSSANEKLMKANVLSNSCRDYGAKQPAIARRLTYECHEESRFLGETRSTLIDDMMEKLVVAENIGSSSERKYVYAPPRSVKIHIKSPLIEPRRPLHGFTSRKRKCDFSSQLSCSLPMSSSSPENEILASAQRGVGNALLRNAENAISSDQSKESTCVPVTICESKGVGTHHIGQAITNRESISWRDGKYVKAGSPVVHETSLKHSSLKDEHSNSGEASIMGTTRWNYLEDRSKKSWADMVEEEEERDCCGEETELSVHTFSGLLEKPSCGAPIQFLCDGDVGQGLNDENRNLNIMIHSAPHLINQMESLRQKVAGIELQEGHQTRSGAVRQCLKFNRKKMRDTEYFSEPSPLTSEAGKTEEGPFWENIESLGFSRSTKPRRRRLQVFQDITRLPLSA